MPSTQTSRRLKRSALHKTSGQSIALIALILLVLVAATGLAVDGGNAYQNQRSLDQAASAAALAGMNYIAQQKADTTKYIDNDIKAVVLQALTVNKVPNVLLNSGMPLQPGQVGATAKYMDKEGKPLANVGSLGTAAPPRDTWYISVQLRTPVETYFARVVGTTQLNVSALSMAGICPPVENVYPLTVATLKVPQTTPVNTTIMLTRNNTDAKGDFNWLRWEPGTGADAAQQKSLDDAALKKSLSIPGDLSDGFKEGTTGIGADNGKHNGTLEVGDWAWSYPHVPTSANIGNQISALKGLKSIVLPIFDGSTGTSPNISYQINRLALFRLVDMTWNGTTSITVKLTYLGEATGDVCQASPPPESPKFKVEGHVNEILVKETRGHSVGPVDVQIVFDISQSMREGWTCTGSGCLETYPNRRVDAALPALRNFVNGLYANNGDGSASNAQTSLVTFGRRVDSDTWTADLVQDFVGVAQKDLMIGSNGALNAYESDTRKFPQAGNRTPTPLAIKIAIDNLKEQPSTRTDSRGRVRPVKKVILLVTDGLANTPIGGEENCRTNNPTRYPVPSDCYNDPDWQSKMFNGNYDPPNSPIGKTVDLLNGAKVDGVHVFVIGVALLRETPQSLKFDLMASDPDSTHLYNAENSSDMSSAVQQVKDVIYDECAVEMDPARNANGAEIILHDANTGDILKKTTTDQNGNYTLFGVEAGRNYTLEIRHLDVRGGDTKKHNYDLMYVNANQTGPIPFDIRPDHSGKVTMNDVTLQINPAEAETLCPAP